MRKLLAVLLAAMMLLSCAFAEGDLAQNSVSVAANATVNVNEEQVIALLNMAGALPDEQSMSMISDIIKVVNALSSNIVVSGNIGRETLALNGQPLMNVWYDMGSVLRVACDLIPSYVFTLDLNQVAALISQLLAAYGIDLSNIDLSALDVQASLAAYMAILEQYAASIPVETEEGIFPINGIAYTGKTVVTLKERDLYNALVALADQAKKDMETLGLSSLTSMLQLPGEDRVGDSEVKLYAYTSLANTLIVPEGDIEDAPFTVSASGNTMMLTVRDGRDTYYFTAVAGKTVILDMLYKSRYTSEYRNEDVNIRLEMVPGQDDLLATLTMTASGETVEAILNVISIENGAVADLTVKALGMTADLVYTATADENGVAVSEKFYLNEAEAPLFSTESKAGFTDETVEFPVLSETVTEIDLLKLLTGELDPNQVMAGVAGEFSVYGLSALMQRAYAAMPEVAALINQISALTAGTGAAQY